MKPRRLITLQSQEHEKHQTFTFKINQQAEVYIYIYKIYGVRKGKLYI